MQLKRINAAYYGINRTEKAKWINSVDQMCYDPPCIVSNNASANFVCSSHHTKQGVGWNGSSQDKASKRGDHMTCGLNLSVFLYEEADVIAALHLTSSISFP